MRINGEERDFEENMTITRLLKDEGYDSRVVVVEINHEIIPKEEYDTRFLQKDDTVEITLLPNTSGARNAEEMVRIARLARELGCGNFIKIEIMRDICQLDRFSLALMPIRPVLVGTDRVLCYY